MSAPRAPRIVYRGRVARGGREAGRPDRAPRARASRADPGRRPRRPARRRRRPGPARDRPPARPRHLGPDRRRPLRRGPRRPLAAIAARAVGREYVALVEGCPASRTGTIDAPLGRDHRSPERVVVGGRRPREAVTHFEVRRAGRPRRPARAPPGDRAHAPDPRPHERHRPSRSAATRPTAEPARTASSASSCTRGGSSFDHPADGRPLELRERASRRPRGGARASPRRRAALTPAMSAKIRRQPQSVPAATRALPGDERRVPAEPRTDRRLTNQ